jgi:hypothetical protein
VAWRDCDLVTSGFSFVKGEFISELILEDNNLLFRLNLTPVQLSTRSKLRTVNSVIAYLHLIKLCSSMDGILWKQYCSAETLY